MTGMPQSRGAAMSLMQTQTAAVASGRERSTVRALRASSAGLFLHEADAPTRPLYERFIARRFAENYGAQLYHFMPRLFGLHEPSGRLVAAFGLTDASSGPLFVEHYLDRPAIEVVSECVGSRVPRARLAEIGNLAGATPGALRQLIPVLTEHLHEQGYTWLLFTGSARLRNGFSRLGLPLTWLAHARLERIAPAQRHHWGRYYDHEPAVMLGDIRGGHAHLSRLSHSPRGLDPALAAIASVGVP
jgi:hypothetical protein